MKKYALDSWDDCNIGRISHVICQIIWSCKKILTQKWTNTREYPQSMCQLIMIKLAIPDGVTQEEYWERLIRDATNNKFWGLDRKINFSINTKVCTLTQILIKAFFYSNQFLLFACFVFAEDKHIGWCPSFDNSGRNFVELRSSWTKPWATSLTLLKSSSASLTNMSNRLLGIKTWESGWSWMDPRHCLTGLHHLALHTQ